MERYVTILLTRISICLLLSGLFLFIPSTSSAEEFECVHCYSGIWTRYHENYELPTTGTFEYKGIFRSNSENNLFTNSTSHALGINHGSGFEREGYMEIIIKDQDGDLIVARGPRKGIEPKLEFKHGTGKYDGIKGTFKEEIAVPLEGMMEDLKKYMEKQPPWPDTYSGVFKNCRLWKGTYELPKK
jgi:hypothetical protein